jgi:tripartite-type tricarboxylate transporter receptor subunit TctC
MRPFATGLIASVLGIALGGAALAQESAKDSTKDIASYPSRPIRVLTTTSAGGLSDIFMRALGEELHKRWGQPLLIDNRPGGAQNVGVRACAEAPADGYTICIINADPLTYNPFLFKNLPFDPDAVQPVTGLFHLSQILVVSAALHVKTVSELVTYSKQKPGTLSYSTASPPLALYMENLKKDYGADWVRVPFKGGGDAVNGILSGSTPIGLIGVGNVMGHMQAGTMNGLVIGNDLRSPLFPDVPTLAETGYRGASSRSWYGLFTPPGVPRAIVDKLAKEVASIMAEPAFRDRNLIGRGLVPGINSPDAFARQIREDRAIAGQVVKDSGLEMQ